MFTKEPFATAVKRSYGYDRTGNLTHSTDQRTGTTQFEYDKLGRITKAGSERFAFDPAHNILDIPTEKVKPYPAPSPVGEGRGEGKTAAPLSDDRSVIPDNRLKTYNGTTYYYDDFGNLIYRELADGEVQNYFYDLHDQLVKAEIFKKDGTKETWAYSYEPLAQVHNRTDEEGESGQQTRYFHCDQIGIPREMTDDKSNLVWFGDYYGWGKLKSETNVTGTAHQPFRLQNQYCDEETGLHYNFFRYYEPDAGRFVNQDPIGLEGGENLYAFAPNTVSWTDPFGLFGFAGTISSPGGFGSSVATTGRQSAAAANNAVAAIVASQSKSHTAVGRCNKDEKDPCSQFPTKNAARIIALKEAGIPTSSTPIAQNITPNWEQYMYKNPNGSRTPLIVSHHPSDAKHPCPHWHVGTAKMDGNLVQKRNNGNGTFSWKYYKDNVTVQHRK